MRPADRNEISDRFFFFLLGCLSVFSFWLRFKIHLVRFYLEHRILIAILASAALLALYFKTKAIFLKRMSPMDIEDEVLGFSYDEDSLFAGITDGGKRVYIKQSNRRMHTQVVGTTNAGKTESVILPWAIDDIRKGRGLLIVDGKSDRSLLDKLYAYSIRFHREIDVKILSLCAPEMSHTFNPLAGGTPLELTERLFKAFVFENEYFKNLQYEALLHLLLIFQKRAIAPTPFKVVQALRSAVVLKDLIVDLDEGAETRWARDFLSLTREEREQRTSGLVTQLQIFAVGETASIFNSESSDIDLAQALERGDIVYCQLPVLKIPVLGRATGKLILQCLQSAISSRHLGEVSGKDFFSVYLDDFTEYLTEGFVSLLNKSRSANVAVVFAHQALGDLAVLGEGVKNTILTNANLKIFMRTNEPESADYFSGVIGTSATLKVTERQKRGFWGAEKTGDGSVRDVEEFKFHPNLFKQQLGVGEAVMVLPHGKGSLPVRIKFRKSPDLDAPQIPLVIKPSPVGLIALNDKIRKSAKREGIEHLLQNKTFTQEVA